MTERIRSRPYVWQPVPWTEGRVLTRGCVDGLPALTWGRADRGELATARQLRELGLRPAGAAPVAVLVFGHRAPDGPRPAVEYASLYRISEAAPKRTATTAQRAAIDKALAARRTCRDCGGEQDYYLPTSERRCWPCSEVADSRDHDDDRSDEHDEHNERAARCAVGAVGDDEADGWRVAHDAAMRAEDPHRPITELDVTEPDDGTGHEVDVDDSVAIPAQRTGPPATAPATDHGAETGDRAARDAAAEPVRVEHGPAAAAEETVAAVGRAQHALTRIAQRRTSTGADLPGAERARAGRLAQWHADDRAAQRRQHEMEGLAR